MARTPVLPMRSSKGALTAQFRRPRTRSATSAERRLPPSEAGHLRLLAQSICGMTGGRQITLTIRRLGSPTLFPRSPRRRRPGSANSYLGTGCPTAARVPPLILTAALGGGLRLNDTFRRLTSGGSARPMKPVQPPCPQGPSRDPHYGKAPRTERSIVRCAVSVAVIIVLPERAEPGARPRWCMRTYSTLHWRCGLGHWRRGSGRA